MSGVLGAGASAGWTPPIGDGTYFWRVRADDGSGNPSDWSATSSFSVDETPPKAPIPGSVDGLRAQSGPALTARINDPTDPGDEARLFIEICSDADCTKILTDGYSGFVPVGTSAGWQTPAFGEGTYYWRALAEDIVGNRGNWSATRSFVVDTVAPSIPLQGGVSNAALVNKPRLSGTFSDADPGDSGTLEFQVCADADCATVVADGSSASVAAGQTGSWTARRHARRRCLLLARPRRGRGRQPLGLVVDAQLHARPDTARAAAGLQRAGHRTGAHAQRGVRRRAPEAARLRADRQRQEDADARPEDAEGEDPPAEARHSLVRGRRHRSGGEHERGDADDRHVRAAAVAEADPRAAPRGTTASAGQA